MHQDEPARAVHELWYARMGCWGGSTTGHKLTWLSPSRALRETYASEEPECWPDRHHVGPWMCEVRVSFGRLVDRWMGASVSLWQNKFCIFEDTPSACDAMLLLLQLQWHIMCAMLISYNLTLTILPTSCCAGMIWSLPGHFWYFHSCFWALLKTHGTYE